MTEHPAFSLSRSPDGDTQIVRCLECDETCATAPVIRPRPDDPYAPFDQPVQDHLAAAHR